MKIITIEVSDSCYLCPYLSKHDENYYCRIFSNGNSFLTTKIEYGKVVDIFPHQDCNPNQKG